MKKQPYCIFDFSKENVSEVDEEELLRFRKLVQKEVVDRLRADLAEQRAAVDRARKFYIC